MEIYWFQKEIINREDLAYRYAVALDNNDTDTLKGLLILAGNNPKLAQLIDEIDVTFAWSYLVI